MKLDEVLDAGPSRRKRWKGGAIVAKVARNTSRDAISYPGSKCLGRGSFPGCVPKAFRLLPRIPARLKRRINRVDVEEQKKMLDGERERERR